MQYESVTAALNGNFKRLGFWQTGRRDGRFGTLYDLAHDARRALEGHWQAAAKIQGDARRSAFAQREDIVADARDRLRNLGSLTNRMLGIRREVETEAAELARVPGYNGDAAQVAIDLALAQHIRAMDAAERSAKLLMGTDPDLVRAVLRLPTALTGISTEFRAKVLREEVYRREPTKAQEQADLQTAMSDVSRSLSSAWSELARSGNVELQDQIVAAGNADAARVVRPDMNTEVISGIAGRVLASQGE